MKIEEQVLSIEQMQHLKDLGVEVKDTAMAWFPPYKYDADGFPSYLFRDKDSYSVAFNDGDDAAIPTLTLQEILEMLPKSIVSNEYWYALYVDYEYMNISYSYKNGDELSAEETFAIGCDSSKSLLQASYEALCWCAENGYLNNKENENN